MPTKEEILEYLQQIKPRYEQDGIVILGLFGSFTEGDANEASDIDVLVETDQRLIDKFGGLGAFSKLAEVKETIRDHFHREVDLADKTGLGEIGQKYIVGRATYL